MGKRIDQFSEDLRLKLTNIDTGLGGLKAKIDGKAQNAEQEARSHLERVQMRIEQDRNKVSTAQAQIKNWTESRQMETRDKIAEWKSKLETSKLQNRADRSEQYAAAAIVVATEALDEAEQASLEAWLARQDADSAQVKQTARA
jgi:hypothetical protein